MTGPPRPRVATAVVRAAHPLPSAAVTAVATVLVAVAGNSAGTCALAAAAVLSGQLVVGWSNDRIDVRRDRRVGHEGKPLAAGAVPLVVVDVALGVAVASTCVLSLLLGRRAGGLHLAAVAAAVLYNVGVKAGPLSWLPYGFAFGALPAVATLARPDHPLPAGWLVAASALVGIAANFANADQVLSRRPRSDVRGLPDRIGGRASLVVAAVLVAVAAALVTAGPPGPPRAVAWAGAAVTGVLLAAGLPLLWRRADRRAPFYGLLVVVPVQILVVVLTARPLH